MAIQAKINLHLWLLTGRCSGFVAKHLNTGVTYPTSAPSDLVVEARKLLKLDVVDTDFYVFGAAASSSASTPSLRSLPDDASIIFANGLNTMATPTVTGATLAPPNSSDWPSVKNHPTLAAYTWVKFTLTGSTKMTSSVVVAGTPVAITTSSGVTDTSAAYIAGNMLYIAKSSKYGVNAAFDVSSTAGWNVGSVEAITVNSQPSRYPYSAMANIIRDNGNMIKLMASRGTLEAFASSSNPVLQVGALASAIMLDTYNNTTLAVNVETVPTYASVTITTNGVTYVNNQLTVSWRPITVSGSAWPGAIQGFAFVGNGSGSSASANEFIIALRCRCS